MNVSSSPLLTTDRGFMLRSVCRSTCGSSGFARLLVVVLPYTQLGIPNVGLHSTKEQTFPQIAGFFATGREGCKRFTHHNLKAQVSADVVANAQPLGNLVLWGTLLANSRAHKVQKLSRRQFV